MRTLPRNSPSGFTLIEMLIVLAIIALLMGAATIGVAHAKEQAYKTRTRDTARQICQAWNLYLIDNHQFPEAGLLEKDGNEYVTSRKSLETLNAGKKYLEIAEEEAEDGLLDHWGNLFRFRLDDDYDGKVKNPAAGTESLHSGDDCYANAVAWSLGPKGKKVQTLSGEDVGGKWLIIAYQ